MNKSWTWQASTLSKASTLAMHIINIWKQISFSPYLLIIVWMKKMIYLMMIYKKDNLVDDVSLSQKNKIKRWFTYVHFSFPVNLLSHGIVFDCIIY